MSVIGQCAVMPAQSVLLGGDFEVDAEELGSWLLSPVQTVLPCTVLNACIATAGLSVQSGCRLAAVLPELPRRAALEALINGTAHGNGLACMKQLCIVGTRRSGANNYVTLTVAE